MGGVGPKVSLGWRPHEVQKERMKITENNITKEKRGLACPVARRDAEDEGEDRGCPGGVWHPGGKSPTGASDPSRLLLVAS